MQEVAYIEYLSEMCRYHFYSRYRYLSPIIDTDTRYQYLYFHRSDTDIRYRYQVFTEAIPILDIDTYIFIEAIPIFETDTYIFIEAIPILVKYCKNEETIV